MKYGAVCNFTSCTILFSEYTATLITGLALIFVGWMYGTGVVLALDEQWVRLSLLPRGERLTLLVSIRCSMGPYVTLPHSYVILLSEYTATLIMDLHWSSLGECMKRVPCWPWTISSYVCSYCCVYDWPYSKVLAIGYWCSMQRAVCDRM